jgi:hypothetical protein
MTSGRIADILSASGRSPLKASIRIALERLFALRAQADRMSALHRTASISWAILLSL